MKFSVTEFQMRCLVNLYGGRVRLRQHINFDFSDSICSFSVGCSWSLFPGPFGLYILVRFGPGPFTTRAWSVSPRLLELLGILTPDLERSELA